VRRLRIIDDFYIVELERGIVDFVYHSPLFVKQPPRYRYWGTHANYRIDAMRIYCYNELMMKFMIFHFRPFGGGQWHRTDYGYMCDFLFQNKINEYKVYFNWFYPDTFKTMSK
jgi:hypothetical protein